MKFSQVRAAPPTKTDNYTPDTTADWNCHCEWPDNEIEDSTTAKIAGLRILSGKSYIQTEKEGEVDNKTKGIGPGYVL